MPSLLREKPCLCISDEAAVRHTGWDISRAVSKGVVKTFNTLETLAGEYGIPLQGLAATLSEFNNITGSKIKDRFGRKMPDDALPIQTLPYYAMRVWAQGSLYNGRECISIPLPVFWT